MNERSRHPERDRHRADALQRAIERFQHDQAYETEYLASADPQRTARKPIDAEAPRRVACPIHGTPARLEMNGGAAQVWFCCDVLLSLVRELSDDDEAR